MTHLGLEIKGARDARGLSQKALAEKVGVTTQAVSSVEKGKSAIHKTKFKVFAKALKIKPEVLVDAWLLDVKVKVLKASGVKVGKALQV